MSRTILSPRFAALTLTVGLLLAVLLPAAAANAAAYRYWGYFQLDGDTWAFAPKGPDQMNPADGAVEGYRFAIGTEGSTRLPRVQVTFDDLCGDTEAESGKKRVGVVLDYGRKADTADSTEPPAPVGRCALVDTRASGAEVLAAVAEVRTKDSLVCAIDGNPASGCGEEVKTVSAEAKAPDTQVELASDASEDAAVTPAETEGDSNTGTFIGIGVVALALAALAIALLHRRSASA